MTDVEAEAMLAALRAHYREPVLPLSRFCKAITTWCRAIERANVDPTRTPVYGGPGRGPGADYWRLLRSVELGIRKSSLLYRLLYHGEALRSAPCPLHQGRWDGQATLNGCRHGCDGTGWLREAPRP